MNQKIENLDLREIIQILKKHVMLLIVMPLTFGLTGFAVSYWLIPPQYEAVTTLIVNAFNEKTAANITYEQVTVTQQLVNTYSIILKSDTVLDQVIMNLNMQTKAKDLAETITIESINKTEVIKLTVRNRDPAAAANIANEITNVAPQTIMNTMKAGSVVIISPAKKADEPSGPNILLNTAISLLAGFVISIVISLSLETMNNKFSSGDDVQKFLQYSVIGVIPSIKRQEITYMSKVVVSDAAAAGVK